MTTIISNYPAQIAFRIPPTLIILEYHEIIAAKSDSSSHREPSHSEAGDIHAVAVENFAEQLDWLKDNGYQFVRLSDWVAARRSGKSWPLKKSVAITFDDGYLDNYTEALPILRKYNCPATIFLATGFIGGASRWRAGKLGEQPMLTWEIIQQMLSQGVEFGSHTVNHVDLTRLPAQEIDRELRESRSALEENLGGFSGLFSYPYSRSITTLLSHIRNAGYLAACTYLPFYVGGAGSNLFELQRIGILANDQINEFRQKITASPARRLKWQRYQMRRRFSF